MKEHTDVPQDPFADGITNPIRETPIDVGAPAFPPNQEASPSTVVSAEPTVESGGPIGEVHTTHDNLADC